MADSLCQVLELLETLKANNALGGVGFLIARDAAESAGFKLRVTSNRKVNIKKGNRRRPIGAFTINGLPSELYGAMMTLPLIETPQQLQAVLNSGRLDESLPVILVHNPATEFSECLTFP